MDVLQGFEGFILGKVVLGRERSSMLGLRDGLYIPEPSRLCLENFVLNDLLSRYIHLQPLLCGVSVNTVGYC